MQTCVCPLYLLLRDKPPPVLAHDPVGYCPDGAQACLPWEGIRDPCVRKRVKFVVIRRPAGTDWP